MECTAARLDGSFLGRRGPSQALVWLSPLLSSRYTGYALCLYTLSRSQDLALLPRCCSISVSRPSKPAAFPAFNRLRPLASSSRLKGLVSSVGGWLLLGTIVLWCSPGGLRCSTLLPLDNSWLAINFGQQ